MALRHMILPNSFVYLCVCYVGFMEKNICLMLVGFPHDHTIKCLPNTTDLDTFLGQSEGITS